MPANDLGVLFFATDYRTFSSASFPIPGKTKKCTTYTDLSSPDISEAGSWEARFTPGRHCIAFKGFLGLDDDSDDGSSGTVSLTADDVSVYESPALTPGTATPVTVVLDSPYRLGIVLTDTTPGGTDGHDAIESYPSIGDPNLLCRGV